MQSVYSFLKITALLRIQLYFNFIACEHLKNMSNEMMIIWFTESKTDRIELKFIFPLNLLNEMINHSAVYNYFVHSDTQLEKD